MKRLIAHRGVVDGDYSGKENTIDSIISCLRSGYEVEVDVTFKDGVLYLGHDEPQEKLTDLWLAMRSQTTWIPYSGIWYHCKDSGSMDYFKREGIHNYFFHDLDGFTITSKGHFWTADLIGCYPVDTFVVAKTFEDTMSQIGTNCAGICSPFVGKIVNIP
jgi:glycerophosphoryl diester phosphodiesterase